MGKKIDLISFANGLGYSNYFIESNAAFAAIVKLSKISKQSVKKTEIIDLTNKLLKDRISLEVPEGALWDDIFSQLKKGYLLELDLYTVSLTDTALDELSRQYPDLDYEDIG